MMTDFYTRTLELVAVISEEWGEAVKELNDFNWKMKDASPSVKAIRLNRFLMELDQMKSPMKELRDIVGQEKEKIIGVLLDKSSNS